MREDLAAAVRSTEDRARLSERWEDRVPVSLLDLLEQFSIFFDEMCERRLGFGVEELAHGLLVTEQLVRLGDSLFDRADAAFEELRRRSAGW